MLLNLFRQSGVFQPISTELPIDRDIELTKDLDECLRSYNIFKTEEELQQRLNVLRKIDSLVESWVKKVSEQKKVLNFHIKNYDIF